MAEDYTDNEFEELMGTGYTPPENIPPEEEFFHSIYISGVMRQNHIGVMEEVGKLQIRGVQYNLNEINMIITHVKPVLVKREKINEKNKITCFSYQNTKPWKGREGYLCGTSRDERDSTPKCKGCRGELIVSGLLCNQSGTPTLNDGKPIFVFIRGKGIKSPNVYEYLDKIAKMEIEPPIFPDNPSMEKMVVKNKRHVTNIKVTTVNSKHGWKTVFSLDLGTRLKDDLVREVLKIQKKTIKQFNDKFDWSNMQSESNSNVNVPKPEPVSEPQKTESVGNDDSFSIENITF